MHRFFIPPAWIEQNRVTIRGPQAHQIAHVLRMRPGDSVIVLDNSGWEIETRLISVERHTVRGEVQHRRLSAAEPRTKISLYQGVLRSRNLEFALQKGTELGVVEFVPIIAERCVISDLNAVEKKHERWESIIQEAAEQCRRGRKPALRPAVMFSKACEMAKASGGLSLIPWEQEGRASLRELLTQSLSKSGQSRPPMNINLFVGPEGGFTAAEVDLARRYGLQPVTLGARILRAETAGLAAVSAILYQLGDLE